MGLLWEGPASHPQSTLSPWKKPPTVNKRFWPLLNQVPKIPCWSKLSELLWLLMSKLDGLVVRRLFVSTTNIKMKFLDVVGFKGSNLTDYCLSYWFVYKKLNTYSALFVPWGLSHLLWFQGLKYIPTSFWHWVKNHDVNDSLGHSSFIQLFYDVEKLRRKPKTFVKVTQRFWYV